MRAATLGLTALLVGGCAGQVAGTSSAWYAARAVAEPTRNRVVICHAFGCARRTAVALNRHDLAVLKSILAAGTASPAAERAAARHAVQWFERRVGPIVGSDRDVGGLDLGNAGVPGQMDCIDEATNTTSLFLLLERNGLMRHHRPGSPVARGFFLDGRYPHATATLLENATGTAYAVDSWPHANGALPDVMPLTDWIAASPSPGTG